MSFHQQNAFTPTLLLFHFLLFNARGSVASDGASRNLFIILLIRTLVDLQYGIFKDNSPSTNERTLRTI